MTASFAAGSEAALAARRLARDAWATSACQYFVEAARSAQSDPSRSLEKIRLFLEGWAHAVCLELEETFKPNKGASLHRIELAKALEAAVRHLPAERRDLVRIAKTLGDLFHHNQGAPHRTTARMAQGVLMHCAELLEWMHSVVLRREVPLEVKLAIDGLHSPPAHRWRSNPAFLIPSAALAGVVLLGAARHFASPSAHVVATPDVAAFAPPQGTAAPSSTDVLQWVKRYEAALAARDIPKILALHRFPAKRWFLAFNAHYDQVRHNYEDAFKQTPARSVSFRDCSLTAARAVRCQAVTEPLIPDHPDGVSTCLVFDDAGRLTARTELKDVPQCPPIE